MLRAIGSKSVKGFHQKRRTSALRKAQRKHRLQLTPPLLRERTRRFYRGQNVEQRIKLKRELGIA